MTHTLQLDWVLNFKKQPTRWLIPLKWLIRRHLILEGHTRALYGRNITRTLLSDSIQLTTGFHPKISSTTNALWNWVYWYSNVEIRHPVPVTDFIIRAVEFWSQLRIDILRRCNCLLYETNTPLSIDRIQSIWQRNWRTMTCQRLQKNCFLTNEVRFDEDLDESHALKSV